MTRKNMNMFSADITIIGLTAQYTSAIVSFLKYIFHPYLVASTDAEPMDTKE